jgi:hypothetical protein
MSLKSGSPFERSTSGAFFRPSREGAQAMAHRQLGLRKYITKANDPVTKKQRTRSPVCCILQKLLAVGDISVTLEGKTRSFLFMEARWWSALEPRQ